MNTPESRLPQTDEEIAAAVGDAFRNRFNQPSVEEMRQSLVKKYIAEDRPEEAVQFEINRVGDQYNNAAVKRDIEEHPFTGTLNQLEDQLREADRDIARNNILSIFR